MRKDFFFQRPKLDYLEGAQNARYTHSQRLYKHILDDLDPQSFTLEEIRAGFNALTKRVGEDQESLHEHTSKVDFGPADLALLQELGLIAYDEESKSYRLTKTDEDFAYGIEGDLDAEVVEDEADTEEFIREHR